MEEHLNQSGHHKKGKREKLSRPVVILIFGSESAWDLKGFFCFVCFS